MPIILEGPAASNDAYASLSELKSRMSVTTSTTDAQLEAALVAASRNVDDHCDRWFGTETVATARLYYPLSTGIVFTDDFHTTDGLVVKDDAGNDGTYETTWASADYQLEPLNGIVDGETGWPYNRIKAVASRAYPVDTARIAPVQVTAKWGWAAVPSAVKEATLILAEALYKLKDAPHGVAGFDAFGSVRVRENPYVSMLLRKYERHATLVG